MTWTRNGRIICDTCNKFAAWDGFDEYTPFGCSSYDPPEPHEPSHICKKCSEVEYQKYLSYFKNGGRSGNWQKSNAEVRAARDAELVWINDKGFPQSEPNYLMRKTYQYITKEEYERCLTPSTEEGTDKK